MRKFPVLIGSCMIVALVLTVMGQEPLAPQALARLDAIMKEVGPTNQALQQGITAKDAAKIATDAAKMQDLMTQSETVFMKQKMQGAADLAKAAASAAAETVKAAKAGNVDAAVAAAAGIGKCKACHALHREQLPDKSFTTKR
jgi:hypothetical protein